MAKKLKPFEKLITVMISGKPVTVEEIETTLGNEIHMYRLSTYIWHIKEFAGGVVKVIKDGRKVSAYQIMNVKEVNEYMKRANIDVSKFIPGQATKITRTGRKNVTPTVKATNQNTKVKKLKDLGAQPVTEESKVDLNKNVDDEIVVTEITE
jgi:hypothetical protein